eukprot:3217374-Alexandrium_andersonii.AAC.1
MGFGSSCVVLVAIGHVRDAALARWRLCSCMLSPGHGSRPRRRAARSTARRRIMKGGASST